MNGTATGPNPYDGGGTNLNPRPVGRNPIPRTTVRTRARRSRQTVGRHNPAVIGATVKSAGNARADMLYGY